MLQSPPAIYLATLARLADRRRIHELSDLLRHPDVETWLRETTDKATNWISIVDEYRDEHIPDQIPNQWLGHLSRAKRLAFLWGRVSELLPETPNTPRALPEWSEAILEALRRLYGGNANYIFLVHVHPP